MSSSPSDPLLTVRTAVMLLITAVVGIVAGGLGFLAYRDAPVALLLAGGPAVARWRCSTVCSPTADEHHGAQIP